MNFPGISLWVGFLLVPGQNSELSLLRQLYAGAAVSKTAARQLQERLLPIGSNSVSYGADVTKDKIFLLTHTSVSQDTELKKMTINYMTASGNLTQAERKGLEH